MCLMYPKTQKKKKRKKHGKSILQDKDDKTCYLCALLYGDYHTKTVEEHHIIHGTAGRQKSEELGLKVNLCIPHHRTGKDAVHNGGEADLLLKQEAQRAYERTHTREEWMREVGKNFLASP